MQLKLSVHDLGDEDAGTVMAVETDASASVGALATALVRALGGPGLGADAPALFAGAVALDPDSSLRAAGLRDGSVLGLSRPVAVDPVPEGRTEIRIVSGAGAGTTYIAPPGDYLVGSGDDCRIRLPAGALEQDQTATVRVLLTGEVDVLSADGGFLDTEPVAGPVRWRDGAQLALGASLLETTASHPARAPLTPAEDGLGLEFTRPPRFVARIEPLRLRLPQPPTKPDKRPVPLLPVLLLPAASALVSILATGRWTFLLLALLSPLGAILTRFSGRRQALEVYQSAMAEHEAKVAVVREDVEVALLAEQRALRSSHPDPAALLQVVGQPSGQLWERRWEDPDFLSFRVGTAALPSVVTVEDPAQDENRRTSNPSLHEVPVRVDLRLAGVAGVAGPGAEQVARWAVAQAASLHSPTDLRLVLLVGSDGAETWSWTRWLPHAQPSGEDAYALVGSNQESLARRLGELGQIVQARTAAGERLARGGTEGVPDILVVLTHARRARSLPGVVALLRDGPAVGVFVLCVDTEERLLPEECGAVVVVDPDQPHRSSVRTGPAVAMTQIRTDRPEPGWYDALARALAPVRAVGEDEESALPTAVRLLDVLGLEPPTAAAVVAGWSLGGRSTTALLGAGYDGPFSVDLVRDGPHALVAGTTGSGKSELLQSLVAALAVVNRPDEMTFVLVDYKGGSAFAECADLPHTVGLVTDLDAHLVERALVSLSAELRRREAQLAAAGARDIEDYLDKRARGGDVSAPLPRLLLVIDEFASMVRELPDFITGLVNIAQRGRSLGIHLVLATQRPGGAVTPDIRANTNLRIALRTTDTTESRDIIDAPDAGGISSATPGRAFARLGPSALLPFQSARVGGRRRGSGDTGAAGRVAPVRARVVSWDALGGPLPARPTPPPRGRQETAAVTDLAVLVEQVAAAAHLAQIDPQPSPWLPPLPALLDWERPADPPPTARRDPALPSATFGIIDRPQQQDRAPLVLDLDTDGHLHVIGSPRSGRSQTLRTLAASLAAAHGADDLHLYGIDCGNGALNVLSALPHCGAVVERRETERLGRLLDRLNTELSARQALLGQRGTADLAELRRSQDPSERTPHIVLLVDRVEVFDRELTPYDNGSYLERLVRLLRDGPAAGIHLVLAGDRVLGGSRYSGTTDNKLVLGLNDRQDYSSVGVPTRSAPENLPPGRAVRVQDLAEVQIMVLGTQVEGAVQAQRLAELAEELRRREAAVAQGRRPFALDPLPERIDYAEARRLGSGIENGPGNGTGVMHPLVAVGGDTLRALGPDLADVPSFVVAGPPRTGRSTALLVAVESLLDAGSGVVVVAPRRSPLRDLDGRPGVAAVLTDAEVSVGDFRRVLRAIPEPTAVVVVDDAELLIGSEIDQDLALLARGAQGTGWGLLVAGNAESLSLTLAGWVGQVKRNRSGMLLSPQSLSDGEVIGVRLSRGVIGGAAQPGRGLLHRGDGSLLTVQVPWIDAPRRVPEPGSGRARR